MTSFSIAGKMKVSGVHTAGFDYLRIGLAVIIVLGHSVIFLGPSPLTDWLWAGPLRIVMAACVPMFFALSGFLTAGSYFRSSLHHFVLLRLIRLVPALAVEVTLSALFIGLCFSTLPATEYLSSSGFYKYFLNIVGIIHYNLPGVFLDNPDSPAVNSQLWTIPIDLLCYLLLISAAICGIFNRPLFLIICLVGSSGLFNYIYSNHLLPTSSWNIPKVAILITYVASVAIYCFREKIPYSHLLGVVSLILSAIALNSQSYGCLAPLPLSYCTIWLGLMRPPRIPFGDLSYGVYLFHLPIQQSLIHLLPGYRVWWIIAALSLPSTMVLAWLSSILVERLIADRRRAILAFYDTSHTLVVGRMRLALRGTQQRTAKPPSP